MAEILFVAKLSSEKFEKDLKNLGSKVKPIDLPANIKAQLPSEIEAISVTLNPDIEKYLKNTRSQLSREENKLFQTVDLKLNTQAISQIEKELRSLKKNSTAQISPELNESAIAEVNNKLKDLYSQRQILLNVEVDKAEAEKELKELTKNQSVRVRVDLINSFPKIEAKIREEDRLLLLQLSRNPKIKLEQTLTPGVVFKTGVSARDGFRAGFNFDFNTILSALINQTNKIIGVEKDISGKITNLGQKQQENNSFSNSVQQGYASNLGQDAYALTKQAGASIAASFLAGLKASPLGLLLSRNQSINNLEKDLKNTGAGNQVVTAQSVENLTAKNAVIEQQDQQKNPFVELFKTAGNTLKGIFITPIQKGLNDIFDGINYAIGTELFQGIKSQIESTTSLQFSKLGQVIGTQTVNKGANLAELLGLSKGKDDFVVFLDELSTYFDKVISKNPGTLESLDATTGQFRKNYQKSAEEIRQRAEANPSGQKDLLDFQVADSAKGVTFVVGGLSGKEGKTANLLGSAVQQILPNQAVIPFEAKNTDTSVSSKDNLPKFLTEAVGGAARRNIKGFSPDAVKLAEKIYAFSKANPNTPIAAGGYSGGGFVVTEAAEILKELGVLIKTFTAGTPFPGKNVQLSDSQFLPIAKNTDYIAKAGIPFNSGANTEEFPSASTLTDKFPIPQPAKNLINSILPIGFEHSLESYVLDPNVQQAIQNFIEGEVNALPEEIQKQINLITNDVFSTGTEKFKSPNLAQAAEVETKRISDKFKELQEIVDTLNKGNNILAQAQTELGVKINEPSNSEANLDKLRQVELTAIAKERDRAEKIGRINANRDRYKQGKIADLQSRISAEREKIQGQILSDKQITGVKIEDPEKLLPSSILPTKEAVQTQVGINRKELQKSLEKIKKDPSYASRTPKLEALSRLIQDEINKISILIDSGIADDVKQYLVQHALPSYKKDYKLKGKVDRELEQSRAVSGRNEEYANRDTIGLAELEKKLRQLIDNNNNKVVFDNASSPPQSNVINERIKRANNSNNKNFGGLSLASIDPEIVESATIKLLDKALSSDRVLNRVGVAVDSTVGVTTAGFEQISAAAKIATDSIVAGISNAVKTIIQLLTKGINGIIPLVNDFVQGGKFFNERILDKLKTGAAGQVLKDFASKASPEKGNLTTEIIEKVNTRLSELPPDVKSQFEIKPESVKVLGAGFNSQVLGDTTTSGKKVAYKVLDSIGSQQEVNILKELQSSGIVPKIELVYKDLLIFEQIVGKSLKKKVSELRSLGKENEALKYIQEAGEALKDFHDKGFTHGDFNPGNIIFDEQGNRKVVDFQYSKKAQDPKAQREDIITALGFFDDEASQQAFKAGYGGNAARVKPSAIDNIAANARKAASGVNDLFKGVVTGNPLPLIPVTKPPITSQTQSKEQIPQALSDSLAKAIARISLSIPSLPKESIPKLSVQPNTFTSGASYSPNTNQIEIAQKYFDVLRKDPTKLNRQEAERYLNAIKLLVHELRHAAQSEFGTNKLFSTTNLDEQGIKASTNVAFLKATEEELKKIQVGLDFSTKGQGSTVKSAEEDAYVFTERYFTELFNLIKEEFPDAEAALPKQLNNQVEQKLPEQLKTQISNATKQIDNLFPGAGAGKLSSQAINAVEKGITESIQGIGTATSNAADSAIQNINQIPSEKIESFNKVVDDSLGDAAQSTKAVYEKSKATSRTTLPGIALGTGLITASNLGILPKGIATPVKNLGAYYQGATNVTNLNPRLAKEAEIMTAFAILQNREKGEDSNSGVVDKSLSSQIPNLGYTLGGFNFNKTKKGGLAINDVYDWSENATQSLFKLPLGFGSTVAQTLDKNPWVANLLGLEGTETAQGNLAFSKFDKKDKPLASVIDSPVQDFALSHSFHNDIIGGNPYIQTHQVSPENTKKLLDTASQAYKESDGDLSKYLANPKIKNYLTSQDKSNAPDKLQGLLASGLQKLDKLTTGLASISLPKLFSVDPEKVIQKTVAQSSEKNIPFGAKGKGQSVNKLLSVDPESDNINKFAKGVENAVNLISNKFKSINKSFNNFVFPEVPKEVPVNRSFRGNVKNVVYKSLVEGGKTLTNQIVGQQANSILTPVYNLVNKVSPDNTENARTGVNKLLSLTEPVKNLLGSVLRLRGSLDFSQELEKFKNTWEKNYNQVRQGADFDQSARERTALKPKFFAKLPGFLAGKGNDNIATLPKQLQQLAASTSTTFGFYVDAIVRSGVALSAGFKLGYEVISKPFELIESFGNSVIPEFGTKMVSLAKGFLAFNTLQTAANFLKDFTQQAIKSFVEIDKLKTVLQFATGSPEGAKKSYDFAVSQVNRLKIPLQSALEGYTKLKAAAIGSPIAGSVDQLFAGVGSASTTFSLSEDQQSGVLLALQQVISKGTVQSEELRGQLAERIPGAIGIASRALQVSELQLNKLLKAGLVTAADFIPKFSDQLEREFGTSSQDAADNLSSSIFNLQNKFLQLKVATGEAISPYLKTGLNFAASGLELVTSQGDTLITVIRNIGLGFLGSQLIDLTRALFVNIAGMSAFRIAGLALSTVLGAVAKVLLPMILNFLAVQAVITTTTAVFGALTDKGGDIKDFADSISERFNKIQVSAKGVNQELNKINEYRPPAANIFDSFGRSIEGLNKPSLGGAAKGAGDLALIGGGAGAVAGAGAAALGGTGALAALGAGLAGVVTGILGAIAAVVGAGINVAVTKLKTGKAEFYGYSELSRDNRRIAASDELGAQSNRIVSIAETYTQGVKDESTGKVKIIAKGAFKELQELDQKISSLSSIREVVATTDKSRAAKIDEELKQLTEKRKVSSKEIIDFQSALNATIADYTQKLQTEKDPQVAEALRLELVTLTKRKQILDSTNINQADPLIKFAKSVETLGNALDAAEIKASKFIATRNALAKQQELKTLGTDIFAPQKSAAAQASTQVLALGTKKQDIDQVLVNLKTQVANPVFNDILKELKINENSSLEELKNKLIDLEDSSSNGSQLGTKAKPAIQALIQIKEQQDKLSELDIQIADAQIQKRQTNEQLILSTIEENNKKSVTSQQITADQRIAAIKKLTGQGIVAEGQAATTIAKLQIESSKSSLSNLKKQYSDLLAQRKNISAVEFNNRKRDLTTQIASTSRQVDEQSSDLPKQEISNQVSDTEKFFADKLLKLETSRATGKINSSQFNQDSLQLNVGKQNQLINQLESAAVKNRNNPLLLQNIQGQIGTAQKARLDAIQNYYSTEQAIATAHYDKLQAIEENKFTSGKQTQEQFNKNTLKVTQDRLTSEENLVRQQLAKTPKSNTEQVDKLLTQQAAIAKKRLDANLSYYTTEQSIATAHYDKLQALEENKLASGEQTQTEFSKNTLKIIQDRLTTEAALVRQQLANTPQGNTEQIDKLLTQQAAITKKRLDANKNYYEGEIKLVEDYGSLINSANENNLESGLITLEEYNRRKYSSTKKSLEDQLVLLEAQLAATPVGNTVERNQINTKINTTKSGLIKNDKSFFDEEFTRLNQQIELTSVATKQAAAEREGEANKILLAEKNTTDAQITADKLRLDSKVQTNEAELISEKSRLAALEERRKTITDPRDLQANSLAIAQKQLEISNLVNESVNTEISLQENARKSFERNLDLKSAAQRQSSQQVIRLLENEAAAIDLQSSALGRQSKLLKSQSDLAAAGASLQEAIAQAETDKNNRGLDLAKKRDDKNTPEVVKNASRQILGQIYGNQEISQRDILLIKQQKEVDLALLKLSIQKSQLAVQEAQARIQGQQDEMAAKRSLLEAQSAQGKAKDTVSQSEANLAKAQNSGDKVAITNAEIDLAAARDALSTANGRVGEAGANVTAQVDLNKNILDQIGLQQQVLDIQQQITLETLAQTQLLERADLAVSGATGLQLNLQPIQRRFTGGFVQGGEPVLIGEDRLTGAINPRTTEIFVPHSSGTILNSYDTQRILNPAFNKKSLLGSNTTGQGDRTINSINKALSTDAIVGAIEDLKRVVSDRRPEQNNSFTLIEDENSVEKMLEIHKRLVINRI